MKTLSVSSVSGDGCLGRAEAPGCRSPPRFPPEWRGPGRGRAGRRGGAGLEAELRRAPCVYVNVSVLHSSIVCRRHCCRYHCRCWNRRSSQPRASPLPSPTGEKQPRWGRGSREGCGNRGRRPAGASTGSELAGRKHVPAGVGGLLPLRGVAYPRHDEPHTYHVSVPPSENPPLATFGHPGRPWDRERVGAHHAVGSGGCTSSRAWHGQMRLSGRPGLKLRTKGGKEEGSYLLASLPLTITTHTHTTCHLLWPLWKLQKKTGSDSLYGAC